MAAIPAIVAPQNIPAGVAVTIQDVENSVLFRKNVQARHELDPGAVPFRNVFEATVAEKQVIFA